MVTRELNVPIYMSYEKMRAEVKFESAKKLETTGKIYFYQQYLFINEPFKGIHIYDNSSPSTPKKIGFINIPGRQHSVEF